jgi:peptidoglycan-associated lipoprotein
MKGMQWFKILACVAVSAALCSGCNIFGKKKTAVTPEADDLRTTDIVNNDLPMTGQRTTGDGTPVPASEFTVESVLFSYDSYQIAESEVSKVEKVAEFMKKVTEVKLVTEGHCDERGSNEYNMSLGEHRALAVRAYLVGLGIDGSRIQTRSFGEEKPKNAEHGESAWRENRRVEFALFR